MANGEPPTFSLDDSPDPPPAHPPQRHIQLHTPLLPVALFFLLSGLVLGVFAMLYGTERHVQPVSAPHERHSEHDTAREPSPLFNLASLAAFSFGFGLTAYLLTRHTALPIAAQVVIAGAAGGAALALQSVLIARWAIPAARAEHVDERFLLQGTIGRITASVPANAAGEMVYMLDGKSYALPAKSIDNVAIAADTDVVIDRVEDGVAYVELWTRVESRL